MFDVSNVAVVNDIWLSVVLRQDLREVSTSQKIVYTTEEAQLYHSQHVCVLGHLHQTTKIITSGTPAHFYLGSQPCVHFDQ